MGHGRNDNIDKCSQRDPSPSSSYRFNPDSARASLRIVRHLLLRIANQAEHYNELCRNSQVRHLQRDWPDSLDLAILGQFGRRLRRLYRHLSQREIKASDLIRWHDAAVRLGEVG